MDIMRQSAYLVINPGKVIAMFSSLIVCQWVRPQTQWQPWGLTVFELGAFSFVSSQ